MIRNSDDDDPDRDWLFEKDFPGDGEGDQKSEGNIVAAIFLVILLLVFAGLMFF